MRSPWWIVAATLAAGTLLLAQNPGNGKANGRGDRLVGQAGPNGSSGSGTVLLNYNGGPVMTGQTHIYYIFYGNWSVDTHAAGILNNFANNLIGSGYYNILTQYYQNSSSPSYISNSVVLSGSTTSTYVAANPTNLSDSDISGIVQAAIGNHSLPLDANGIYFVLTAPGVGESSGFLSQYCGWHTATTISGTWIKYSFVGDAGNNSGCSVQFSSSPNNDPPVDAMITVIAHELSETVTDPLINAWYDVNGQEIGDKCAWTFGTEFTAPNGSTANITLGGFDFLIQQEFSNASDSCVMTYQATPDYSLSVSPSSQSAPPGGATGNYTVTVNATNGFNSGVTLGVSGLPAGATLIGPSPATTQTTATFSISVGASTLAGTYTLTITGTSGSLTHNTTATLVVPTPDFSLSVSPASQSVIQGGTTANSYVVSVKPLNGFNGTVTFQTTAPSGITVNGATSSSFTVTAGAGTTIGTYTLTITGTNGSLKHTINATVVVNPAGTFTVSISPSSQSIKRGGSVSYTVTIHPVTPFNSAVTLSVSGLPNHATSNFPLVTSSGGATLTIKTASNTSPGTSTIKVTGVSGNLTPPAASATLTVTK